MSWFHFNSILIYVKRSIVLIAKLYSILRLLRILRSKNWRGTVAWNWSKEILSQKMAILDAGRACRAPLQRFVWRRKRERRAHSGLAICVSPRYHGERRYQDGGATFGNGNARYWEIYKDTWSINWTGARRKFY